MADESAASHVTPPPRARTDLITAAVLLAFAAAAFAGAWAMPTFTDRGGDPFTAPGIVPGFHAVVIGLLSLVLGIRAVMRGALAPDGGKPPDWRKVEGGPERGADLAAILEDLQLVTAAGTVDNFDDVDGPLTVVLALAERGQGVVGHYGRGAGAEDQPALAPIV